MSVVLTIPDLQIPFHHPDAFAFLKALNAHVKPDTVVCIGDEIDFHAISDYAKDPDGLSPHSEWATALAALSDLYRIFPACKAVTSNHTLRPWRKAFKAGLPKGFLRDIKEILQAPQGWHWRESWDIDGVRYEHGDALFPRGGSHTAPYRAILKRGQSVVFGHILFCGFAYHRTPAGVLFGVSTSALIDPAGYAFAYHKGPPDSVPGAWVVYDGVHPVHYPLLEDRHGRWTGTL